MAKPEWFQKQTVEHLRTIRASRRPGDPEYQMADDAIRQKESDPARQESAPLEQIEAQRHQELISSLEHSKSSGNDKWYKKPVGIIFLSVSGGLLLLLIKYLLGL
jgi:hypothetical protein